MNGHVECSTGDAAAYVLGALESYEVEPFRDHLASCVICRDEVAALQVVADMLPSTVTPTAAPGGLRKRVLSTVYDEAEQLQPVGSHRDRAVFGFHFKSIRGPLVRPVMALGATALVAIGVLLGTIGFSSGTPTRVIQATVPNSPALTTAELRVHGGSAELVVAGMPPPPSGQVYEVWVQRGARTDRTNALFTPTTNGSADVDIPGDVKGVSTVMVTAEPAGGTDTPTTSPVIRASLD
ncbi:MAG TPA: anti-sigma factor [Solirubrobacteraceae bacterium]|nr:anti-sigma factor [Solirubrobacteraceae bacterium]